MNNTSQDAPVAAPTVPATLGSSTPTTAPTPPRGPNWARREREARKLKLQTGGAHKLGIEIHIPGNPPTTDVHPLTAQDIRFSNNFCFHYQALLTLLALGDLGEWLNDLNHAIENEYSEDQELVQESTNIPSKIMWAFGIYFFGAIAATYDILSTRRDEQEPVSMRIDWYWRSESNRYLEVKQRFDHAVTLLENCRILVPHKSEATHPDAASSHRDSMLVRWERIIELLKHHFPDKYASPTTP